MPTEHARGKPRKYWPKTTNSTSEASRGVLCGIVPEGAVAIWLRPYKGISGSQWAVWATFQRKSQ